MLMDFKIRNIVFLLIFILLNTFWTYANSENNLTIDEDKTRILTQHLIEWNEIVFQSSYVNTGNTVLKDFFVHVYIDIDNDGIVDKWFWKKVSAAVIPGQRVWFRDSLNNIPAWTHSYRVYVDGTAQISEWIEIDNGTNWENFSVREKEKNLSIHSENTRLLNDVLKEWWDIDFQTAFTNTWELALKDFFIHIYIDLNSDGSIDKILWKRIKAIVEPGQKVWFSDTLTSIEKWNHQYRAYVDGTSNISEWIEIDNWTEWRKFFVKEWIKIWYFGSAWEDQLSGDKTNSMIYQYSFDKPQEEHLVNIHRLLDNNVDLIIEFYIFRNQQEKLLHEIPPTEQEILSRAETLVKSISWRKINWYSRTSDYLESLYDQLNTRYPQYKWKQWYSPSKNYYFPWEMENTNSYPLIRNEWWIFDQYNFDIEEYNLFIERVINRQNIDNTKWESVIWLTPDQDPNVSPRYHTDFVWWDNVWWKNFYNSIAQNQKAWIDTYFYMFSKEENINWIIKKIPLWKSKRKCTIDFVSTISQITIPYILNNEIDLDIPNERPNWIPWYSCD